MWLESRETEARQYIIIPVAILNKQQHQDYVKYGADILTEATLQIIITFSLKT